MLVVEDLHAELLDDEIARTYASRDARQSGRGWRGRRRARASTAAHRRRARRVGEMIAVEGVLVDDAAEDDGIDEAEQPSDAGEGEGQQDGPAIWAGGSAKEFLTGARQRIHEYPIATTQVAVSAPRPQLPSVRSLSRGSVTRHALHGAAILAIVSWPPLDTRKTGRNPFHSRAGTSAADASAFMVAQSGARARRPREIKANQGQWVADNFITDDTEALSAEVTKNLNVAIQRLAIEAKAFDRTTLDPSLRRKFNLLKLSLTAPPPSDPADAIELSKLTASMAGTYGKGTYCKGKPGTKQTCMQIGDLSQHYRDEHESRRAARCVARLAHDLAPAEGAVRAVCRPLQQGRPRARLQGRRRDVALEL